MSRAKTGLVLLSLLLALPLTSCRMVRQVAAKYPRPDVALLYRDAASNRERNPVILIPGFAGTRLVLRDGRVVWGTLFTEETLPHSTPEGLRALALDVGRLPERIEHRDLADLEDDAIAIAPLAHFQADAVVTHVSFDVYASMLELLGDAGYISESGRNTLRYDPDHFNCFTFVYDWRRDNVANARTLGRFIESARLEVEANRERLGLPRRPVKFDVVAHSMGGLIARYYLRYGGEDVLDDPPDEVPWAGAPDIDRLILIATPSFGTVKALRDMIQGRSFPLVSLYQPTLMATVVALYQMMPRPRHHIVVDKNRGSVDLDFTDVDIWLENRWGPFEASQERYLEWLLPDLASADLRRRRMADFMRAAFERARLFAAALDRPAATRPATTVVLFAGDTEPTPHLARLVEREGRRVLDFDGAELTAPGDGTVTRSSALADERLGSDRNGWLVSPVPWDWTFFIADRHTSFLKNPTLQDNLLHLLLETPPRTSSPSAD